MSLYESTFIVRHDMSTQQVEQLAETFTEILKSNGGEITKTEFWGLKTLAYRINKNRKGHYVHFNLDTPSAALHEMERNMRLSEDVLRILTVRVDELDPEPSPMMQVRASRDDRARRGPRPPEGGETAAASGDKPTEKPKEKATEKADEKVEDKAPEKVEDKADETKAETVATKTDESGDKT